MLSFSKRFQVRNGYLVKIHLKKDGIDATDRVFEKRDFSVSGRSAGAEQQKFLKNHRFLLTPSRSYQDLQDVVGRLAEHVDAVDFDDLVAGMDQAGPVGRSAVHHASDDDLARPLIRFDRRALFLFQAKRNRGKAKNGQQLWNIHNWISRSQGDVLNWKNNWNKGLFPPP